MYDKELKIYTCNRRTDHIYKLRKTSWKKLVEKLKTTTKTSETVAEFRKMSKEKQNDIKDVGGFFGGTLKEGKRKSTNVIDRCLIALDLDFADTDFVDMLEMTTGFECVVYSTHKHTPDTPKLRILFPTDRPMTPDEYEPVARYVADQCGNMDVYDDTTFQPSRMMFWPSTSADGEYLYRHLEGEPVHVDKVLSNYNDWTDTTEWPVSSRIPELRKKEMKKAGDPLEKPGLIGAFCRTYTVQDAIATFIPDVYTPTDKPDRWTYVHGSTGGGLVIYDDRFAYSNHATDPAGQQLCNAFDLVRIHKFNELDEDAKPDTPVNRMPSYTAMTELCANDEPTKQTHIADRWRSAEEDFGEDLDEEDEAPDWLGKLTTDKKGNVRQTIDNIVTVLTCDRKLKEGIGGYDEFHRINVKLGSLPWWKYTPFQNVWSDTDDSNLSDYLEKHYGLDSTRKMQDALNVVRGRNAFHPVRDYLDGLEWDGVERLDTIFIDYLGAEDNEYTRAVGRKIFTAAVNRIYAPGCKMDYMPVLVGDQGIGKSHMLRIMGGEGHSDSLTTVAGKDAYEALDGVWIMEMAELAALSSRKADIESTKMFISKQSDTYRKAYGRNTMRYERQCVFIGTTNDSEFLKDFTGNRRFWPIDTDPSRAVKDVFTDLPEERDQLWAEAKYRYRKHEPLYLPQDIEKMAIEAQQEHLYMSAKADLIQDYLDTPRPYNWKDMSIQDRIDWLKDPDDMDDQYPCNQISILEIWCECLGGIKEKITNTDQKEIGGILRYLGWERQKAPRQEGLEYGKQRVYTRKR